MIISSIDCMSKKEEDMKKLMEGGWLVDARNSDEDIDVMVQYDLDEDAEPEP